MTEELFKVAFNWQAWAAGLVVGIVASIYLIVRLKLLGVLIVVGIPAAVIAFLVAEATTTSRNDGGLASPLVGLFMYGWLLLLATPFLLGAVGFSVALWSAARDDTRLGPRSAALAVPAPAPASAPAPGEPILETTLVRPGREPGAKLPTTAIWIGVPLVVALALLAHGRVSWARNDELLTALRGGNLELVRARIRGPRDANREPGYRGIPLHIAAVNGHPRVVEYLLSQGADVAARDGVDRTALEASLGGREEASANDAQLDEVVALLVDHGSPVEPRDVSAIFALEPHGRAADALGRMLLTPERIDKRDPLLAALLRSSAYGEEDGVVLEFLERGGDVELIDEDGDPLLTNVMSAGRGALARELLRRGAEVTPGWRDPRRYLGRVDLETVKAFLSRAPDLAGVPVDELLQEAVKWRRYDTAEFLLARGDVGHSEAVFDAASRGDLDGLEWLVSRGAKVDLVKMRSGSLTTPLFQACRACAGYDGRQHDAPTRQRYRDVALFLLARGARLAPGLGGEELVVAAEAGQLEVVRALLARGASVDACGVREHTALEAARWAGHQDVVELLLARGANPQRRCGGS